MGRIVRPRRAQIKRLDVFGRTVAVAAVFGGLFGLRDRRKRNAADHEQNRREYGVLIIHRLVSFHRTDWK